MKEDVRNTVRDAYSKIAEGRIPCCSNETSRMIGYSESELEAAPEGTVGLGCGNPIAMASLREGEIVLDLGCGPGLDCFIAARKVGESGKVIGVDMTPEMIDKARRNAEKGGVDNVEFRLGEIENLPVADGSIDVVISNCVINLSPEKKRVFDEAFRTLKPGGRLMVSDIALLRELSEKVKSSVDAYVGCISGAMEKEDYLGAIREAGFQEVEVIEESSFSADLMEFGNDPIARAITESIPRDQFEEMVNAIVSVKVTGKKLSPSSLPRD